MSEDWRLWENRSEWPMAPSEYVFLADAGERIRVKAIERGVPFHDRSATFLAFLHKLLIDGHLLAFIREEGAMIGLLPKAWNCEKRVAEKRLLLCQFNAAEPFGALGKKRWHSALPYSLFVRHREVEPILGAVQILSNFLSPEQQVAKPPKARVGPNRREVAKPEWYPALKDLYRKEEAKRDRIAESGRTVRPRVKDKEWQRLLRDEYPAITSVPTSSFSHHRRAIEKALLFERRQSPPT